MPQYEDNNDFAKYDYYKNGPSGPNIGQTQGPVGAIRGLDVPPPVTNISPSLARQMEDLETELQMAFENVSNLTVMLEPILSPAGELKTSNMAEKQMFGMDNNTSPYFQRMRGYVARIMKINDDLQKIRARIQL
jgi:hypothetical protein